MSPESSSTKVNIDVDLDPRCGRQAPLLLITIPPTARDITWYRGQIPEQSTAPARLTKPTWRRHEQSDQLTSELTMFDQSQIQIWFLTSKRVLLGGEDSVTEDNSAAEEPVEERREAVADAF
ncbi:hypothetical protein BC834DRAFT_847975 [Gloeopeniophorella convolvens]|nr:hypothetical protein BC834DRAFT_847975 [Gloeopeniophorella convolvens]